MRAAFKEWAVIVDALGRGEQIIILRKGGISEGKGGFSLKHAKFWLFPTLFHQQREQVLSSAQARYDEIAPSFPPPEVLRLEYYCEVVHAEELMDVAAIDALKGLHIWRDEVIRERFDWGREKALFALSVKVHRLARAVELPMLATYGGCKSWIELESEVDPGEATPVLSEENFQQQLARFQKALAPHRSEDQLRP